MHEHVWLGNRNSTLPSQLSSFAHLYSAGDTGGALYKGAISQSSMG